MVPEPETEMPPSAKTVIDNSGEEDSTYVGLIEMLCCVLGIKNSRRAFSRLGRRLGNNFSAYYSNQLAASLLPLFRQCYYSEICQRSQSENLKRFFV